MPQRYCLDLETPAENFMDSYLIGNGRLGATVRGGIGIERIDLNVDRLWSGGPDPVPAGDSPAPLLPRLRRAIRTGDFERAEALSRQMQGQGWTQSYQPIAGLLWRYANATPTTVTGYRRRLDMQHALAETRFIGDAGPVTMVGFVSAPADVAVFTLSGPGAAALAAMSLEWDCPHPAQQMSWLEGRTRFMSIAGRVPANVIPPYVDAREPIVYPTDAPGPDGLVDTGMGFAAMAALEPMADGSVRLTIAAACGFRGPFARPSADLAQLSRDAEVTLRAALPVATASLRAAHIVDYRRYFDRADLSLPDIGGPRASNPAEAELLFHFGRYLLISSSRPGTETANLQGIWNPYRRPAWSSNHTTNINTEMNYWPAEPTGLGDLVAPLVTMVEELVEAGRVSARYYYGAPGTVTHHNTDVWRFTRPVEGSPVWANWTSALPWLATHVWDHWAYGSADDTFARTRLLPMLAEIVRFALFMLVEDEQGQLVVSPSSSPEHLFRDAAGAPRGVAEGATMDQELLAELFTRFGALAQQFGAELALAQQAAQALARLRMPDADARGVLREWASPVTGAEPGHRHLSHLYALYPGQRIAPGADTADARAIRAALDDRLAHGTGHTGWSQSWVLCMAARLGDRQLSVDAIATLLTKLTTRALLVLHPYEGMPGNAVFQIDGNFGATAGITELLLQSTGNTIILLRTLPDSWDQGAFTGLRARGGHVVDARWSAGRLVTADIAARRTQTLALDIPDGPRYQVCEAANGAICPPITGQGIGAGRRRIEWQVKAGVNYRISAAS